MAFDPASRVETWVFQRIRVLGDGRPLLKRLPFNFVSYDDSPERVIEPLNNDQSVDDYGKLLDPISNFGQVASFEIIDGHYPLFEVMSFQ